MKIRPTIVEAKEIAATGHYILFTAYNSTPNPL